MSQGYRQGSEQVVVGASFTTRRLQGDVSVGVHGELDLANAAELEATLVRAGDDHHTVLLDLGGLSFIDCAAFSAIIGAHLTLRTQGVRLLVLDGSLPFRRLLTLVGAGSPLEIVDPSDWA